MTLKARIRALEWDWLVREQLQKPLPRKNQEDLGVRSRERGVALGAPSGTHPDLVTERRGPFVWAPPAPCTCFYQNANHVCS